MAAKVHQLNAKYGNRNSVVVHAIEITIENLFNRNE